MNKNEVEIIEGDIASMPARQQESGAIFDAGMDNIFYLADRAEKIIAATNRIMEAALKITNEMDWVLIGGTPYLQESGASKVAQLFGISTQIIGNPTVEVDAEGYKTYTYKIRFMMKDRFVECEGSRSMKEDFFAKQGKDADGNQKPLKKPDEIDERDVKMAAYTNALNNGIKRMIAGLRNIDVATLERNGFDTSKMKGYTFKEGSKGGTKKAAEDSGLVCSKCGKAVTQKVASYSQSKFGDIYCMDCQKGAAANG